MKNRRVGPRLSRSLNAGGSAVHLLWLHVVAYAHLTLVLALGCGTALDPHRPDEKQSGPGVSGAAIIALNSASLASTGRVYSVVNVDGAATKMTSWDLPPSAWVTSEPSSVPSKEDRGTTPPPAPRLSEALSKDLADLASARTKDHVTTIVITFQEDRKIPLFPEPDPTVQRDHPRNQAALQSAQSLALTLANARSTDLDQISDTLRKDYGANEIARFWIIKALTIALPLSAVPKVLTRSDVQYIEYDDSGSLPPANMISDGRALLNTDYYFNNSGSWIGLIDTGIRKTHQLISAPNIYDYWRDCVNGTNSDCTVGTNLNPDDDCWNHGTPSANILSGNNNFGGSYLGVTPIVIDSWKAYPAACGGLNISAAVRAFQGAVVALDKVIVAELQAAESDTGATSSAADAAFNSGAVVVAAAGNHGPASATVTAPGNAHKVLAIGAVDVTTLSLWSGSGRGPAPDSRFKPDLVSPHNVYAANILSNSAVLFFSGTSCATPFAAGAAALARNFIANHGGGTEPGQTDAFMILGGTQRAFDNNFGAGLSTIPTGGSFAWGSVAVGNFQTVNIVLTVAPTQHMNVAIWWPESVSLHNDIDLYLLRPDGSFADLSVTSWSIFEKVSATAGLQSGNWTVRLSGAAVTGTQTVYFAAHAQ